LTAQRTIRPAGDISVATEAKIYILGIGSDGTRGLTGRARELLQAAELVLGPLDRLLDQGHLRHVGLADEGAQALGATQTARTCQRKRRRAHGRQPPSRKTTQIIERIAEVPPAFIAAG